MDSCSLLVLDIKAINFWRTHEFAVFILNCVPIDVLFYLSRGTRTTGCKVNASFEPSTKLRYSVVFPWRISTVWDRILALFYYNGIYSEDFERYIWVNNWLVETFWFASWLRHKNVSGAARAPLLRDAPVNDAIELRRGLVYSLDLIVFDIIIIILYSIHL